MTRILALTDLSAASRVGVAVADGLAGRVAGEVDIGHVSATAASVASLADQELVRRIAALAETRECAALDDLAASCVAPGRRHRTHRVETGCLRCGVRDLLAAAVPDLVCLAARGGSDAPDLLVGSIAEYAVRVANVPVVVARGTGLPGVDEPLRLLVAVDLLESPATAVERIRWLLGPADALTVVHVVESPVFYPPALGSQTALGADQLAGMRRNARTALGRLDRATAARTEVVVEEGDPGERIALLAEQTAPHLVVVRRRASPASDLAMPGPVCEHLLRHCPTSLLVLPGA